MMKTVLNSINQSDLTLLGSVQLLLYVYKTTDKSLKSLIQLTSLISAMGLKFHNPSKWFFKEKEYHKRIIKHHRSI